MQSVALAEGEYLPTAQSWQVVAPVAELYFPAAQYAQTALPAALE